MTVPAQSLKFNRVQKEQTSVYPTINNLERRRIDCSVMARIVADIFPAQILTTQFKIIKKKRNISDMTLGIDSI